MGYTGVMTYLQTIYYNFLGHPWMVYLPISMVDFYGKCIGIYTIPMDSMGYNGWFTGILVNLVTTYEIFPLYIWIV